MKYVIYDIPPSNNTYMGNSKNFNIYRTEKQKWELMVRQAIGRNKPIAPLDKAVVTITYYFKTKIRHDPDNYSGKFLMDGLVKGGVLKDDSFDNVELHLIGNYDKLKPRTEIEIDDVKER